MTILYRYVTREVLNCFFIVLVAVLSIYLAVDFIEKVDNFMEEGVPVARCIIFLLYKLPSSSHRSPRLVFCCRFLSLWD